MTLSNKRGQISMGIGVGNIVIFGIVLFLVVFVGMIMVFGGITLDWVFDEVTPELTSIGVVEGTTTNMSQIGQFTFGTINNFVQTFTWFSGVIYVIGLLMILGVAFAFRMTGNKWLIVFFFGVMLLIVISCIFLSNIYEDFYNDTGDVSDRLHEYGLLSFMILYSPMIMAIIGFIGGIIMFSGYGMEEEI